MDRNLRTPYNLRSFDHPTAQSTTAGSSWPSSTSASSDRLTAAATSSSIMSSQFQNQPGLAPSNQVATLLPSPSGNQASIFCGQSQSQTASAQNLQGMQTTTNQGQVPKSAPAQSTACYPHKTELGGPTATAPFLRDFSLVAEAAKRAQMAVVMRDLESVTL